MKKFFIFIPRFWLFIFSLAACQVPFQSEQTLPFNPQIAQGRLENGLRYYVLPNTEPENRVYIRLVVNAGSMHEEDDQKGVAHIVEHMAFNGTQKYPANQIIAVLEQLGMKFARDINAFTDFENTVYTLNIAKNDEKSLHLALDVVNEWMNNLTILPDDLDAERGVVLEEWRARLSPMLRLGDKKSEIEMAGSRYVLRDPIGDVNVIKHISRRRVSDFYRTWYRPDNMALIVVGDIDKNRIASLIKKQLSTPNPKIKQPLPKIDFTIPLIPQWRVASVAESGISEPSIELSFFEETENQNTVAAYEQEMYRQIVLRLLNLRLQQWEIEQSAVINSANFYHSHLGKQTLQAVFTLQLAKSDYRQATQLLFEFLAQIQQQGFSESELKAELVRLNKLNEKELTLKAGSLKLADDLIPIAANDQISLSSQQRYRLNKQILATVNLPKINRAFEQMLKLKAKLLLITKPSPAPKSTITANQIEPLWQQTFKQKQPLWRQKQQNAQMPILNVQAGSLKLVKNWQKSGVKEYQLSNGSKLVYLYSDKSPGQVYFKAMTTGGVRSVPNEQYHLLRSAVSVVDDSGIGGLSQTAVNQLFSQNPIAFSTYLGENRQGFTAVGKQEDLENLLKLFRLKLQSATVDEKMLAKYKQESLTRFRQENKENEFIRTVSKLRFPQTETVYSRQAQDIEPLQSKQLSRIYQQYLLDKTDFTYFIVGDIEERTMLNLAKIYLAAVPVKTQNRMARPVYIHKPSQDFVLQGLAEPRAEVEIYFTADFPWQQENEYLLDILADVLQEKLRFSLRENAGGVYFVNAWFNQEPHSTQAEGKIAFSCDPKRIEELRRLAQETLRRLTEQGIERSLLAKKLREKQTVGKQQLESPLVVLGMLEQSYQLTHSPILLYQYEQAAEIITAEKFNAAARLILQKKNQFTAILSSEK